MKLFLATKNKHKKIEMQAILSEHEILIPDDEGIDFNPKECGNSFAANSFIKAEALWKIVHQPVIADDSGLCVNALNLVPGIYSARYAGEQFEKGRSDNKKIPQEEQNRLLIEQLNKTKSKDRSCFYVCAVSLLFSPEKFFIAQETFEGEIVKSIGNQAGSNGFGYDPIVFLPEFGKTVAEISADEKNKISHRGKAARLIRKILAE